MEMKRYRCYYHKKGESNLERDWKWRDLNAGSSVIAKAIMAKELGGQYIIDKMMRWAK